MSATGCGTRRQRLADRRPPGRSRAPAREPEEGEGEAAHREAAGRRHAHAPSPVATWREVRGPHLRAHVGHSRSGGGGALAVRRALALWTNSPSGNGAVKASWRSGYAADCKSVHPGSIPGEASNFFSCDPQQLRWAGASEGLSATRANPKRTSHRSGSGYAPITPTIASTRSRRLR